MHWLTNLFRNTCAPEYVRVPILLLSDSGTQAANNALQDGKISPSPRPIIIRKVMRTGAPPYWTHTGVMSVKKAATVIPTIVFGFHDISFVYLNFV